MYYKLLRIYSVAYPNPCMEDFCHQQYLKNDVYVNVDEMQFVVPTYSKNSPRAEHLVENHLRSHQINQLCCSAAPERRIWRKFSRCFLLQTFVRLLESTVSRHHGSVKFVKFRSCPQLNDCVSVSEFNPKTVCSFISSQGANFRWNLNASAFSGTLIFFPCWFHDLWW